MTPSAFAVIVTSRFERDYRQLLKGHPDLPEHYGAALTALQNDPYN
jgi:hypothetical protein